jgi:nitroreductase
MNLADLVVSRRTVHNYRKETLPQAVVERALELSLWAPNHRDTYPWAYFMVGPEARAKLADLSVQLKELKGALSDIKKQALRENLINPSHLVILGQRKADPKTAHEDYATLACSVQIASLYLAEQGFGSKWSTGGYSNHSQTYEILGISPDQVQLEGALMIGVAQMAPPTQTRPPLKEFLTYIS